MVIKCHIPQLPWCRLMHPGSCSEIMVAFLPPAVSLYLCCRCITIWSGLFVPSPLPSHATLLLTPLPVHASP